MLLAGASGLIGTRLRADLVSAGHDVRVLVRRSATQPDEATWTPERREVPAAAIDWAEALVNLAGFPLSRLPWTVARRQLILDSRLITTATLAHAIAGSDDPPRVWLNASAVGYYGHRPGEELSERSERGSGFLATVADQWEEATRPAQEATRVVHLRTGLVLAAEGALGPLIGATRLGAGATIGTGRQHWPWISLADEVAAIIHLMTTSGLSGPVNLAAPTPARSADITRAIAQRLGRPHRWRLPAWLLRTVMGPAADELLLGDQRVVPSKLLADGFVFAHGTCDAAVAAAVVTRTGA